MEMQSYLRKRRVAYKVTPINVEPVRPKRSYALTDAQIIAKQVAREICGLAPYEKRALDFINAGNHKKAKKFLKKRLGSMARADKKFDTLYNQAEN